MNIERSQGVITKVFLGKGYAFLRGKADNKSHFVHAEDVEPRDAFDTLHEGAAVSYVHEDHPRGPRARMIRVE